MLSARPTQDLPVLLVWCLCISAAAANPNHEDATRPLAVFGGDAAKQLHAQASNLGATALKEVRTYVEGEAKGQLGKFAGKAIGETRVKLIQLQRLASQLKLLGEPAGVDFELFQYDVGSTHYVRITQPWAALPTSQRFMAQLRASYTKQTPARAQALQKLEKLVSEQKWEEGERELYRVLDNLELGAGFLTQPEREALLGPFSGVRSQIENAMNRKRSATAKELLERSRAEQEPNYPAQLAEVQQAIANLGTTGQTSWQGEALTGPQLVGKLDQRWRELHVAALRCRGLDWALRSRTEAFGHQAGAPDLVSVSGDERQAAATAFNQAMVQALAELISIEARRVSASDAPPLYLAYLQALAPPARQLGIAAQMSAVEAALQQLAAKSPGLATEVASYEAATRELLRWRTRAASAMAAARTAEYHTLEQRLVQAATTHPPYMGLFPEQDPQAHPPTLMAAAFKVLPTASQNLLGTKGTASEVLRVAPTSKSAIGQYRQGTYANVPAGLDLAAEVEQLRFDLLLADDAPPLTLAATIAADSAARGDLAAVGGEVVGVHLEGFITRFASLPTVAAVLLPAGVLPTEGTNNSLLPQMLMRFDLKPTWARHDQFYVELSPASP